MKFPPQFSSRCIERILSIQFLEIRTHRYTLVQCNLTGNSSTCNLSCLRVTREQAHSSHSQHLPLLPSLGFYLGLS